MYIKVRNGFLKLEDNKLVFTQYRSNKTNIIIISDSENTFKISINDSFLKANLFSNPQVDLKINSQVDLKIDSEGDSFYLEETTLFLNDQIVYENIYFLEDSSSPLIEAIRRGNDSLAKELIESGNIFPNYVDKYGQTGLMTVCLYNRKELLKLLLDDSNGNSRNLLFKTDLEIQDDHGNDLLKIICKHSNEEILKLLLYDSNGNSRNLITRKNFEIQDIYGDTSLRCIYKRDRREIFKILLNDKLFNLIIKEDLNKKDRFGTTRLMHSCMDNSKEILELLLIEKMITREDLEIQDINGRTVLMFICIHLRNKILELFLNNSDGSLITKRDLEIQDDRGTTPLIFICVNNSRDLLELLLYDSNGNSRNLITRSDLKIKDNEGLTALDYATDEMKNILLNI